MRHCHWGSGLTGIAMIPGTRNDRMPPRLGTPGQLARAVGCEYPHVGRIDAEDLAGSVINDAATSAMARAVIHLGLVTSPTAIE